MAEVAVESSDRPVVQRRGEDEVKTKVEIDMDSGEGEDYSSGSDRSLEAEDVDLDSREETEPVRTRDNSLAGVAERRKRRHGSHGSRRHKGGSRHKNRGFHPYLDAEEEMNLKRKLQELKEKENAAAVVRQEGESRFMNFPIAPFNSTQYLMDEHDSGSPAGMHRTTSSSKLNDDALHSVASTPAEVQHEMINLERKDKEFTDIYATVHAESLQSLPKDELVKNYMSLEEKVAALQKKVAEAEQQMKQNDDSGEIQRKQDASASVNSSDNFVAPIVTTSGEIEESTSFTCPRSSEQVTVNLPTISVGDSDAPSVSKSSSDLESFSSDAAS